jgi:2-hydroxychromene-2-carboxylate isomerase
MVMANVEFIFDFGSPNSYFAHRVIPDIERRTGAKFVYVPALLGGIFKLTNNKPPMIQFQGIKNKPEYEALEMRRFVARHHLDSYQFNPHFPVNTLKIMRGAVAAQESGVLAPYVEAVFHFMWETPRKMDDVDVIRDSLRESGLDADGLLALSESPEIKDRLMRNTADAVERGVFGSPSFFVGRELFFGKDRLREVEEEILRQKA